MGKTKHNRKIKKRKTRSKRGGAASGCQYCPDACSKCYFTRGGKKYRCKYHTSKKRCAGTTGGMFASLEQLTPEDMAAEPHMKNVFRYTPEGRAQEQIRRGLRSRLANRNPPQSAEQVQLPQPPVAPVPSDTLQDEITFIVNSQSFGQISSLKELKNKYTSNAEKAEINTAIQNVKERLAMEAETAAKTSPSNMGISRFEMPATMSKWNMSNGKYQVGSKKSRKNKNKNKRKKSRRK